VALFGEKDFQQLQVIKTLNRDLNLQVEVIGMPTVREPDGLAMSSRNTYLSTEDRKRALSISKGLREAQRMAKDGVTDARTLVMAVRRELQEAGIREDYVELVDARSLTPLSVLIPGKAARLLVAGFLGTTRLIDNIAIDSGG
jgi:pantoate--beta-alanine ligase